MSSVATWGILPLAKLDCHLNQFFFVSSNFFGLGRAKKVSIYVQTTVFPVRPRRNKIPNFWKFTLLGLHYTSFRPTDPPAQDVRTQNLNTSVSALTYTLCCSELVSRRSSFNPIASQIMVINYVNNQRWKYLQNQ